MIGRPELALIGITLLWGGNFLIVHQAMRHSGPLFFVGLRFGTAALIALPLAWPVLRGVTQRDWLEGTMIGVGTFTGATRQQRGMRQNPRSTTTYTHAPYCPPVAIPPRTAPP